MCMKSQNPQKPGVKGQTHDPPPLPYHEETEAQRGSDVPQVYGRAVFGSRGAGLLSSWPLSCTEVGGFSLVPHLLSHKP